MIDKDCIFPSKTNAALVLEDGSVFRGFGVGKHGITIGEICFNTSMTGYQEILTDPSYSGQIITFTFPHIGNVGTNLDDNESCGHFANGLILRDGITNPSNHRNEKHFNDWLIQNDITGISGIDTRALTIHIRENGAQNAGICFSDSEIDTQALLDKVKAFPSMKGAEWAGKVTCEKVYEFSSKTENKHHVVAIDYGAKLNILHCLSKKECNVTVVPATTSAEDILALKPDGIFLSNGPGDPAATAEYAVPIIKKLIASDIPIFGICLGHQLLCTALGCKTEKMHQGHRGANHPVQNLETKIVEITSQNHGFVVIEDTLPDGVVATHKSLFDGTVEGIAQRNVFSVQHHPEASPGPHDSEYLFDKFITFL